MDSSVKIIVDQTFSATSFYECLYRVPLGGKDRVHKQRRFPFRYSRAGSSKTSFSLIPHASRLFMKQFLLNQTMDDADEGCLGGLVFHWYCIVNSRPKSHSDSQPAPSLPLSSFLLFLTSCTPLSLSFPSRIAALPLSPLCIVSRNYSRRGASKNFGRPRLSLDIFPIASVRQTIFLVFACFNIYISSYKSSIMHRLCISYLFIYFSSYSLFRCLARANRSFFSFLLAKGDNIT